MQAQKNGGTLSNKALANMLKQAVEQMESGETENGWAAPASKPVNAPFLGVSVPIKVETPQGSARCYLSLPPEVAASPETLLNAIKQLIDMGIPVDLYQPKENGWNQNRGGNGGGWQDRGGNNGYRGGYNGGGYNNGNGGFRRNGW